MYKTENIKMMRAEIKKYIEGSLSQEEALEMLKLINENRYYLDLYIELKADSIKSKIDKDNAKANVYMVREEFKRKNIQRKNLRTRYLLIASVVVMLISLGFFLGLRAVTTHR